MLKEFVEKIVSLADPHIYKVGNETYTNEDLSIVKPPIDRPAKASFSSLDGIVRAVRAELDRPEIQKPIFVSVTSERDVTVFTTLRQDNQARDTLYCATAVLPRSFDEWMQHEDAMIALRSKFVANEDRKYLLELLSSVSDDNNVQSQDNGMTQTVTARTGVALSARVPVKPIVALRPYRTFLEVEQPESEFLVRMRPGDKDAGTFAKIGILEADGGAWKLTARHNIAEFLRKAFSEIDGSSKQIIVVE